MNSLSNFFYPGSICIAGASSKEKSIGYEILKSIKSYGYTGDVYPVNPRIMEIQGYKCYETISDIKDNIDLGLIVVPKSFTEESIDQLIAKGVKSIILITAGFRETGIEGELAEKRIIERIKNSEARLVGPNCMGVINTFDEIKLNATFVAEKPIMGHTAFLSQSGAIGAAVLNSLRETDIKFGHFISVGNKADISENDLLGFWNNDDRIKTITFYLESFSNGESFINNFIDNKVHKPVILLKAGRTSGGIKAASSHTGALGSSDKVVTAVLDQFGIIRVDDLNELFNTAKGFENFPLPGGNRIAIVTNAGGPSILAVDKIEEENLVIAQLSEKTKLKLKEIVHPEGSCENPVDLLPGGTAEQFQSVSSILLEDKNVDGVISIFVEPVMVSPFDVIEKINSIKSNKPVMQVVLPLPEFWEKYRQESAYKIPLFRNPEDPVEVLSNMNFYSKNRNEKTRLRPKQSSVKNFNDGYLSQNELEEILTEYHIPAVSSILVPPRDINNISGLTFPICLKGISGNAIHKSEYNAVKLNIDSYETLIKSANEIEQGFHASGFDVEKFLIQPFLKVKHEILIGGYRDISFGPMIMFGSGGKYVELLNDICMKSAYLCEDDIEDFINKTNAGVIISGVRGDKAADIGIIKSLIINSAQMLLDNKNVLEFDFNPVIITDNNLILTVDARIKCG
ncbi:MAG: acetate--CoA ligase family protein [Ignavibacteriaceae bacterium]|nr:acetate--CoA ligase family protein [Ignavibacteriaceae bacterium]